MGPEYTLLAAQVVVHLVASGAHVELLTAGISLIAAILGFLAALLGFRSKNEDDQDD